MESIGTQLRLAREAKGLSISEVASATRIKYQHVESMERDDFSTMAAATYARGFIKIYAEYLGLEPSSLLALYRAHHSPVEAAPSLAERHPVPRPRPVVKPAPADEPAPAEAPEAPKSAGSARPAGWLPPGLVKRVILPAAGLVLLTLLVSSVSRMCRQGDVESQGAAGSPAEPLWLEDPPDPYFAAPGADGDGARP